jgi:solute carrier family 35, member E3
MATTPPSPAPLLARVVAILETSRAAVSVPLLVALNVVFSVSTIAVNKTLFSTFNFKFVVLLSAIHFLAGSALFQSFQTIWGAFPGLRQGGGGPPPGAVSPPNAPRPRPLPKDRVQRLAAAGALSIVAANFSLRFNAMGTYQIMKTAVLPAVIVMGLLQRKGGPPTRSDILSSVLIVAGSCMAVLSDVSFSVVGVAVGVAGIVFTAQYQIWGGSEQRELGLTPSEVMFVSALPQAGMAVAAALTLETPLFTPFLTDFGLGSIAPTLDPTSYPWTLESVLTLLLSALFATCLNWTSFAILGKTSPTTLQIVNQTKTMLIIAADFFFFPKVAVEPRQLLVFGVGILCVVGGATSYGLAHAKRATEEAAAKAAAGTAGGAAGAGAAATVEAGAAGSSSAPAVNDDGKSDSRPADAVAVAVVVPSESIGAAVAAASAEEGAGNEAAEDNDEDERAPLTGHSDNRDERPARKAAFR